MKRILLGIASVVVAFAAMGAYFLASRPSAKDVLEHYVFDQCPDSLKVLEYERHGRRNWNAFVHFSMAPEDFPKLLQKRNSQRVKDPRSLQPPSLDPRSQDIRALDHDTIAWLSIRILDDHAPNVDFTNSYEMYSIEHYNPVTESFLTIRKDHSEGYVVVIRH